jgi:uncharacterized protein (DUF2336 family)
MTKLSDSEIASLLKGGDISGQIDGADEKVAAVFNCRDLTPNERGLAEDLFRIMLRDTEVRVRTAFSETLRRCGDVPPGLSGELAEEVSSIAVPMLHYSVVFTDDDLIAIVRTRPLAFQLAAVKRRASAGGVDEPVDDGRVVSLVRRPGMAIADKDYGKVIDMFSGSEVVMSSIVEQPTLPARFAERLIALVCENLRRHLTERSELPGGLVDQLVRRSRDRASLDILSPQTSSAEIGHFVAQLRAKGRLTPALILRALCTGEIAFFEIAAAELAGISPENARLLVADPVGLDQLCAAACLPEGLWAIAHAAVDAAAERPEIDCDDAFSARLLTRLEHVVEHADVDDLEGLLDELSMAIFNDVNDPATPFRLRLA